MPTDDRMTAIADLHLGDRIKVHEGAFGTATVIGVSPEKVDVIRPYIHTSNFSCGARVIPYLGFEEYSLETSRLPVELLERLSTPMR